MIVQEVKDGKIVDDVTASEHTSKKKEVSNEMGKDQFLQLLVAQMQYQDPLEPTSNTEWVAQMATFSMVESLNGMKDAMTEQSAYGLVGKYVILNTGNDAEANYVKGKVDYITIQNGKLKLSVEDKLYDVDTLGTIADQEYYDGSIQANTLHEMITLLPNEDNLSAKDDGLVKSAREAYDALTDTQKQFVSDEDLKKLQTLEKRMDSLKATYYEGLVNKLPSAGQIEAADEATLEDYSKQLAEASEYYDNMTDTQKKNVTEETKQAFQAAESAIKKASEKYSGSSEDDASDSSNVQEILQKILEEIQKKG